MQSEQMRMQLVENRYDAENSKPHPVKSQSLNYPRRHAEEILLSSVPSGAVEKLADSTSERYRRESHLSCHKSHLSCQKQNRESADFHPFQEKQG